MPPEHRSPRPLALAALAILVVAGAYLEALQGEFVWDDHKLIEQSPEVRALQPLNSYFTSMFWSDPLAPTGRAFYRPLVSLSFAFDWMRGGGSPFTFHLTNLLAHLACVGLLFVWLTRRGIGAPAAMTVSALWGTHPRLTESVAWISGRTDILATLFGLMAILLWPLGEERRLSRRLAAAACIAASFFSKELAIAFALSIVAGEWAVARARGAGFRSVAAATWPVGLAFALYVIGRVSANGAPSLTATVGPKRALIVIEAVGTYAEMLLTPWRAQTQIGLFGLIDWARFGLGAAVLAAILAGLVWKRWRPEAMVSALGLVSLGLVLHVVPISVNIVAADRFLYVPLLAFGVLCAPVLERSSVLRLGGLALVLGFAVLARERSRVWASDLALWTEANGNSHPLNTYPVGSLADAMLDQHFDAEARATYLKSFQVQRELNEVLKGPPQISSSGRLNLAIAEQRLGNFPNALTLLEELTAESPDWPRTFLGRAKLELRRLDTVAARATLDKVRSRAPQAVQTIETEIAAAEKAIAEERALPPGSTAQRIRRVQLAVQIDATHLLVPAAHELLLDPACDAKCTSLAVTPLILFSPLNVGSAALEAAQQRLSQEDLEAARALLDERLEAYRLATKGAR